MKTTNFFFFSKTTSRLVLYLYNIRIKNYINILLVFYTAIIILHQLVTRTLQLMLGIWYIGIWYNILFTVGHNFVVIQIDSNTYVCNSVNVRKFMNVDIIIEIALYVAIAMYKY